MAPILYFAAASPPARFVLLTARSLGIDIKVKWISYLGYRPTTTNFIDPTSEFNGKRAVER